eukprot:326906_1
MGAECSLISKGSSSNGDNIDYTRGTRWSSKLNHQTCILRNTPFCIGHYIYYLTDFRVGENGIVIYNAKSNRLEEIISYNCASDKTYTLNCHSFSIYQDKIYIISAVNNTIMVYDLNTSSIKDAISFLPVQHNVGKFSTSLMIHGNIHIIGGHNNTSMHKMYDIHKNILYESHSDNTWYGTKSIHNACAVYINRVNKLFMFGGYDGNKCIALDTFYCSSVVIDDNFIESVKVTLVEIGYLSDVMHIILEYIVDSNDKLNIVWEKNEAATLIIPLSRCGYIVYEEYVFTFGGYTNHQYEDKIFWLNVLHTDDGWKTVPSITCPLKACYHAVLVQNKTVHILTRSNNVETPQHFAVAMKVLLSAAKIN